MSDLPVTPKTINERNIKKSASTAVIADPYEAFSRFEITDEYIAEIQEAEFIVDDLIIRSHMVMICAMPNCGKTAIMVSLCGEIVKAGYRIIYINVDAAQEELPRFRKLAKRDGYKVIGDGVEPGSGIGDILELIEGVSNSEADVSRMVFIIDTFKKFTDLMNKKQNVALLKTLRKLSTRGATIVSLGHCNKWRDDDGNLVYEGTGDIRADNDELIYLEYDKNEKAGIQYISTYLDKVRGRFKPITFEMFLTTREVIKSNDYYDIKNGNEQSGKGAKYYESLVAILECIDAGITIQSKIVTVCNHEHGRATGNVRQALKYYSDEKTPARCLQESGVPGCNALQYKRLMRSGQ